MADDLQRTAVDLLQRLIRLDTVNPPGRELAAIDLLDAALSEAGFATERLAADPQRPNLIARLDGADPDGPVLGLLGHVDTVLADPADWSQGDPWSGEVDGDGMLWGRGAIDMKSQVAAEVAAAVTLARAGWRPARGALKVMCVVDEEAGGTLGCQFLCERHPERVRCDWLLNEGGGAVMPYGDRRLYGVCCAEKGTARFRLHTRGVAGHASMPTEGANALLKLAPLLAAMDARRPTPDLSDEPRALLRALGTDPDLDLDAALAQVAETDPRLAALIAPTLAVTLVPTRAWASEKVNVIPARATVGVDCRIPPGMDRDTARQRIDEVLGDLHAAEAELEYTEHVVGNRSAMDSPLMEAIARWLGAAEPAAEIVPTVLPGFTDSRWFRAAFPDCVAYGFFPQRHMTLYETAPMMHAADERIDVRDLGFAARCYAELVPDLLGTAP